MKYEESNLAKALPTVFVYEQFKVCDMKTFISNPMICCTLTFDLVEKRFRCFISAIEYEEDYEQRAIHTITRGSELPHRLSVVIFKDYFLKEEMIKLLDKDLKLYLKLLEILDEK